MKEMLRGIIPPVITPLQNQNTLDFKGLEFLDISSKIYFIADSGNGVVKGIKCILSVMRICNDFIAKPLTPTKNDNRTKVEYLLEELDPAAILQPLCHVNYIMTDSLHPHFWSLLNNSLIGIWFRSPPTV